MELKKMVEEEMQNYIVSIRKLASSFNFKFPLEFEDSLREAFGHLKVYAIIGQGFIPFVERVSINKKIIKENARIHKVSQLKYPPAKCVENYGRANLKNQSVFYGTFDFITAVKEMKPEIGDLITISKWKIKNKNDNLIVCPMFLSQPKDTSSNIPLNNLFNWFIGELEKFPVQESNLFRETHQFYSDCFARDVNDNQGYMISALLADKILNQYEKGSVDAIIYPSTKVNLQESNIVIKKGSFDAKYELSETVEKRLLDFSDNGDYYEFEMSGKSLKISGDNVIWM